MSLPALSDDIVIEILLRLQIKQVFQFSCVSTYYHSLIHRPDFLQIYRSRNRNLSLIITGADHRLYHSHLNLPSVPHESIITPPPPEFILSKMNANADAVRLTQSVNGLVCVCYNDFINKSRINFSLMSVYTGEIVMKLPDPGKGNLARYFLGFEPVNGVYKLLRVRKPVAYFFTNTIDSDCYDFEILTISPKISPMSWKKLPKSNAPAAAEAAVFGPRGDYPFYSYLDTESYSVNGFLFWLFGETLISFNLRENKFLSIKPPLDVKNLFQDSHLTQFRGQLAFFEKKVVNLFAVIYTYNDKDTCWTRHAIPLPSEMQPRFEVFPVGNLPTGEILLALIGTDDPFTPIYSYDHTNSGSFQKFVVGKFPDCGVASYDRHAHNRYDVDPS